MPSRPSPTPSPIAPDVTARDLALAARVRAGDAAALETLFHAHYPALCALAGRVLGSRDRAEEVVQDLFLRVWAGRAAWVVTTNVRAYLLSAAWRAALNARKRRTLERRWHDAAAHGAHLDQTLPTPPPAPDAATVARDEATRLTAAVASLPERARLAVELRWYQGLSYKEVAAVMGISPKGVENQLARALSMLRTRLDPPEA